jgi:hypothetical protein
MEFSERENSQHDSTNLSVFINAPPGRRYWARKNWRADGLLRNLGGYAIRILV